jgi:hypothetical protein
MAVHIEVHDDRVTVDLDGMEQVWALARHIEIPTANITGARVAPVHDLRHGLGWRVGGAYWPGVVAAGHFSVPDHSGARQFWCVYRDTDVLVIDTDLERPSRVVLQHPDSDFLAWIIGERAGGNMVGEAGGPTGE